MDHDRLDAGCHTSVIRTHPEIGQGAEFVDGMAGVVVPLEGAVSPPGRLGHQLLNLRMSQHLSPSVLNLRILLGPVEKVYQRAIARPGFIRFQQPLSDISFQGALPRRPKTISRLPSGAVARRE